MFLSHLTFFLFFSFFFLSFSSFSSFFLFSSSHVSECTPQYVFCSSWTSSQSSYKIWES